MGIRKHGVGEVLPDQTDLAKQASSQQEWSEQDEQDLHEESEG